MFPSPAQEIQGEYGRDGRQELHDTAELGGTGEFHGRSIFVTDSSGMIVMRCNSIASSPVISPSNSFASIISPSYPPAGLEMDANNCGKEYSMAKLATVTVIEYTEANLESVYSFTDDGAGKKEAGEMFKACVNENGDNVTDEEMDKYLEEGCFEQGDYQVFLTHSSE